MLVLALDTATPAVTAGIVELTARGAAERAVRVVHDARAHAELLMPGVLAACAEGGVALRDVAAVVTGAGPGPFTGLRVGMVTAAALGDALGVPVHGVCSLDAIGREAGRAAGGNVLVVTDARRREVYWAGYDAASLRVTGPHVASPGTLAARAEELAAVAAAGAGAEQHTALIGLPVLAPTSPSPAGLVACAQAALRSGVDPGPLEPLYLRRPDATPPGARKRVSA